MGDRVSVSFRQESEWYVNRKPEKHMDESPVLFHHWGGTHFPKFAFEWFKNLQKKTKKMERGSDPLTRLEPRNLMVQLIAHLNQHEDLRYTTKFDSKTMTCEHDAELVCHSIYLGKTPNDGDNSDNGHYVIDVDQGKMYNDHGESIE
tara:strand:- start:80 stop:520 length:441 start_codon:yes stop_codon:yes gene_type:complete